jgi:hypothetical protein
MNLLLLSKGYSRESPDFLGPRLPPPLLPEALLNPLVLEQWCLLLVGGHVLGKFGRAMAVEVGSEPYRVFVCFVYYVVVKVQLLLSNVCF